MTAAQQRAYFDRGFVAWQLGAATKCLGREGRAVNPPPSEINAKWRVYAEAIFPRYGQGLSRGLDDLTKDMAITQIDMTSSQRHELDRACAVVPPLEP